MVGIEGWFGIHLRRFVIHALACQLSHTDKMPRIDWKLPLYPLYPLYCKFYMLLFLFVLNVF